ncbi:TetR/AcrR family transcriptional regulator [Paraburkholderia caffeinilytica]|uniref:TetR/AcrR family transcriptional regulator n=1 Tax=Paraburkholderia caffeinilytica TaxID=1761016 RepID=UPI0038B6F47C
MQWFPYMSSASNKATAVSERSYHHGDLRRTLLEHGWDTVVEGGGKDISLREVARRAGVSPGAAFHHFRNKDALLAAVSVEGFARLTQIRQKRTRSVSDPREKLRIVLHAYVEFAIQYPAIFFLMFRYITTAPDDSGEVRMAALASFDVVRSAISDATGDERAESTLTVDAWAAWAAMHGAASLLATAGPRARVDPEISTGRLLERTVNMVLDGLACTY